MVRNIFEGSEFLLYNIDNEPIALSNNCKLVVKQNTTDVTTKDSQNWTESITSTKDWSIEFEGLVSYEDDKFNTKYFLNQYENKEPFFIQFGVIQGNFNHTYWGEVLLESIEIDSENGEVVSYSGSLKGVGKLEFTNDGSPIQNGYLKTETDPVFRGSAAFNITQTNKNDWFEAYNKTLQEINFSTLDNVTTLKVKLRDGSVYSSFFNQVGGGSSSVDLSNYYNKTQSENLFQLKGNYIGLSYLQDYYFSKTESDGKYYLKSNPDSYINKTTADSLYKSINYVPTWGEITSKPSFFSGNYEDLANRPALFSGNYNHLYNSPVNLSYFSNDAGYVTASIVNGYALLSDVYSKSTSDGRYQPLENQRLSSGNNVTFNKITAVNEMIIPSSSSTSNNSIWIGNANNSGNTPAPSANYLRDLLDVDFGALQNGQSIQYDSASGNWKNVNLQIAGNYALANGSNASGTWGINISGNAQTATNATNADKFVGYGYEGGLNNVSYILGFNGNTNNIGVTTSSQVRTWLGMKDNTAYHQYHTPFGTDANTVPEHTSSFTYAVNAPANGYLGHFGANGYGLQLNADYGGGFGLHFRVRNGDEGQWNPWRRIWSQNDFEVSESVSGYSVVRRNANGDVFARYFNTTSGFDETPMGSVIGTGVDDGYIRKYSKGALQGWLNLGSLAYRDSIAGREALTSIAYASDDIGVAQMLRWKNYGNGHVIFDASAGTAPDGSGHDRTNSEQAWTPSYPTLMGWNGGGTFGVRVDSARTADLWGGYTANFNLQPNPSDIQSSNPFIIYNSTRNQFEATSVNTYRSVLGLGASAFTAETLDSVTTRNPNVYRAIHLRSGSALHYWDSSNTWSARGDMRGDTLHQYVDAGTALPWKENWWDGEKYHSMYASGEGFTYGSKILALGGSNGAETYNGGIEVRGTNAGITYHNPGHQARNLWMNNSAILGWTGLGFETGGYLYAPVYLQTGRVIAGYDSGVGGSINTNDYLRVAGGGGVHWASYGTSLEPVDGNTIRYRSNGAGTTSFQMTTSEGTARGYLYGDSSNNFGLLHHGGGWTIRSNSGRNIYLNETEGNTFIGTTSGGEKLNVGGWVSVQGNHGWYNATHGGGIWMNDSTWVRVYNNKNFLVDAQIRGNDFYATSSGYYVGNFGIGLIGSYSGERYQSVFSMGDAYRPAVDGTSLGNSYGIVWTYQGLGQAKAGLGHQMLITEAGVTQTAIGNGIWTRANIYAAGQIEAPTQRATAKMVIPTSAPSSPEAGCIWIA